MDSKSSGFVNKNTKVPYSCSAVASLCNNAKFAVQLEKACPKTCKICGEDAPPLLCLLHHTSAPCGFASGSRNLRSAGGAVLWQAAAVVRSLSQLQ